ncbi:hypothetical protein KKF81_06570 [Candidatus Micrarchaeota archaeon]|nr:hypothetical protein [Candidatus Micrarchaeota archaeon]MBU1166592.1 hypothetical protein [Candidatus Micrarchaeota archaeon]MBU1887276.1 hypothetical protein [Candidatus Micrarchaeota archaeon]
MKLNELIKSKKYLQTLSKIKLWEKRIEESDAEDIVAIAKEKNEFFSIMKENDCQLYSVFEIQNKTLDEKIIEMITGRRMIFN